MAEYAMMVNTVELKPGIADATCDEVSQSLASSLGKLAQAMSKAIPNFQGGGWNVVSHDLTRIDRHLIVTLLLHRDN